MIAAKRKRVLAAIVASIARMQVSHRYACIGSVTNLAARLCSEAKGGQILTNQKTLARIEDTTQAELLGEVTLKGIAQPVPVFNVTAFKS